MKKSLAILLLLAQLLDSRLQAQETAKPQPVRRAGYKRPQAKHRTSRPVPDPWLGYGHDDHPAIRGGGDLQTRRSEARVGHAYLDLATRGDRLVVERVPERGREKAREGERRRDKGERRVILARD